MRRGYNSGGFIQTAHLARLAAVLRDFRRVLDQSRFPQLILRHSMADRGACFGRNRLLCHVVLLPYMTVEYLNTSMDRSGNIKVPFRELSCHLTKIFRLASSVLALFFYSPLPVRETGAHSLSPQGAYSTAQIKEPLEHKLRE